MMGFNEGSYLGGGTALVFMSFFLIIILLGLVFYIYSSLTLMFTAKRLKDKQPWLAWIPVGNLVLMSRLAKMHWWPILMFLSILLVIIPIIGIVIYCIALLIFSVFYYIWNWKICEARKKPGWWVLLTLIPFVGWVWYFVMWGILAWDKK